MYYMILCYSLDSEETWFNCMFGFTVYVNLSYRGWRPNPIFKECKTNIIYSENLVKALGLHHIEPDRSKVRTSASLIFEYTGDRFWWMKHDCKART